MKSGLYHVAFRSGNQDHGHGIVSLKSGVVNGGDDGYVYMGPLVANGNQLSGQLHVQRYDSTHLSVFGPLGNFDLTLAGAANDAAGTFAVAGHVTGQPGLKIQIEGRFLSPGA